ncbi:MAG: peptide/nickel transport system substrate-binding protein [Saprospiraceae bacterium]|jgi:peptide/nickel transport system substrate-binding protein
MNNFGALLLTSLIIITSSCVEKRDLKSNIVVVRLDGSPGGIHPVNGNSAMQSQIDALTQKSLFSIDLRTEKTIPFLIEELPTVDSTGLIYTYTLKKGAYWDNKELLSIEDIIFSTKVLLCPLTNNPSSRPIYASIIDSVYRHEYDETKFYLKTKIKHVNNSEILSLTILQKSHWDPKRILNDLSFENVHSAKFKSTIIIDDWFNSFNSSDNAYIPKNIVGLGPYQVEHYKKDNYISLIRKTDWWGDSLRGHEYDNFPEKIIFKIIKDDAAAYLAIKNQEIDFAEKAGEISKLLKLQKLDYFNENYNSTFSPSYIYRYIGLNCKPNIDKQKPLFVDKRVRKAMAHLVNVPDIMDIITYSKSQRQASIVSPLKASCDTTLKFIEFDVEKAKVLLAEAGWKDTDNDQILDKVINGKKIQFSFKLNYISRAIYKEIAFMIKESMKKAGIDMIANPLDFNTHYKNAANHEFDAMLGGWGGGSGYSDPTQLWSTESWSNKGSNFCGFGNSYSDSLIYKSNTTLDPEKHLEAFRKLQKLIYEEQPYIFLWSVSSPMVTHKRFSGTDFYRSKPFVSLGSFRLSTN